MRIGAEYFALAAKIQESALAMCHEDIRTRLADAIRAAVKDSGSWAYIVAVFGDDKAGDVVYSCNSDLKKASYTMTTGGATIDTAKAVDVAPLTTYEVETVQMGESGARNSKRDMMQLQSIHDHAAALGANCSMKEAKVPPTNTTGLKLVECAPSFIGDVKISEAARTSYPVLLITPGKGSSGHYSREVLKAAADAGKFKAGSLMFWNHATAHEEAQRPEGDLNNLAAILTKGGVWNDNGVNGPGVYGEAKVMADYATKVEERAPHIGLSIRAGGTGTGRLVEGVPELKSIDYVESVDYVTKAGRGGKALSEAARGAGLLEFNEGGLSEMDEATIKKLQESDAAKTVLIERLQARALRADAIELACAILATTSLSEGQRKFVAESVVGTADSPRVIPVKESGDLDAVKLTEAVNAFAKSYSASIPATGGVRGMGSPAPVVMTESAEAKSAREARQKESAANDVQALMTLGLSEADAKSQVGVAA